jgi:hypothetical protein
MTTEKPGFSILFLECPGGDPTALKRYMERERFTHSTFERLASDGVSKVYRLTKPAEPAPTQG